MSYPRRKQVKSENGETYIEADIEDSNAAAEIMQGVLSGKVGSQRYHCTDTQNRILQYLQTLETGLYEFKAIRQVLKLSKSSFSQAVCGRAGRDDDEGLQRIPGIERIFEDHSKTPYLDWCREDFYAADNSMITFCLKEEEEE